MNGLAKLTWTDVVNHVAHDYGMWFNDFGVMPILWEHTGYPCFFQGDPVECATEQLHQYFRSIICSTSN